ncbi:MAG TPA: DUF3105 domain-containing protein [Solirubrobacterales bacterium]|jgi:hypothetical protein|nr:DUF3105 domain-containing protein [Solirubrobacterales bacterium]
MANRREEERERLRQARQEREKQQAGSERRRLMIGYGVAGLVGLAVLAGIVAIVLSAANKNNSGEAHIVQATGSTNGVQPDERSGTTPPPPKVTNLQKAAKEADCDLRLHLPAEGHTHIPPTAPTPAYKTNPPTSGNHVEPPYQQADGAYSEMPQEIDFVHSLEHGRMEVQYSPDLAEGAQLELIGLYDTMYGATLLFPNQNMPYEVAATTWTNLLGCNEYKGSITLDAIRDFGKATWGKEGREPVTGFPFTGPTPKEPTIN